MRRAYWLLKGFGVGAGLVWFFDPDSGRRRRADVRNRAAHLSRSANRFLDAAMSDLRQIVLGRVSKVESALRRERPSAEKLAARVRTALGRAVSHPHALRVEAEDDGQVVLSGPIAPEDVRPLLRAVWRVQGVRGVADRLEVHGEPERVPALQGGRAPLPRRDTWRPAARLLAGSAGLAAITGGLVRRGTAGWLSAAGGALLLGRVRANRGISALAGLRGGRRLYEFHKTIDIAAPAERVFAYLENFENLPSFLSHVKSVRVYDDGRSHWEVSGPAGLTARWDAELTRREENRVLAWKSLPGRGVKNAGLVRLSDEDGVTRVEVLFSYTPPAGALGHGVARLFRADPKRALDDDLQRLKSLLEVGKTTAHGRTAIAPEVVQRI